ncbi:MAG: AbrB/MazE/SpoVT family DNA-binding domain-containing protein [Planctomycetes bacterium]|nr:AbrB/MazE/SpoVT family DNA-binding domain-containing protein [Planctomycetota bacterium]
MERIRIETRDGELSISLPEELVRRWCVRDGDLLDVVEGSGGLYLRPARAEAGTDREAIERILRENEDVLRKLAQ